MWVLNKISEELMESLWEKIGDDDEWMNERKSKDRSWFIPVQLRESERAKEHEISKIGTHGMFGTLIALKALCFLKPSFSASKQLQFSSSPRQSKLDPAHFCSERDTPYTQTTWLASIGEIMVCWPWTLVAEKVRWIAECIAFTVTAHSFLKQDRQRWWPVRKLCIDIEQNEANSLRRGWLSQNVNLSTSDESASANQACRVARG